MLQTRKKFLFLTNIVRYVALSRKGSSTICRQFCTVKRPSSSIWLQVLQSSDRDSSAGLYIFTDSNRYLINTGENTLRHLRESGLATNGLNKILLTGSKLSHIGGLINTLLATQDSSRQSPDNLIDVFSPHVLDAYMQTSRKSFQYLSKFDFVNLCFVSERTCWQEVLNDENFRIQACAIKSEENFKSDVNRSGENLIYPSLAISYAFEVHQQPRRFSMDAARELGISEEMFQVVANECQMGSTVTLPCGKVITPDDVLHHQERKQSFLIIDCPSQQILKPLAQLIQSRMAAQDPSLYTDLIIHLTPLEIARTQEYKSWIDSFDGRTKHLLMSDDPDSNPPAPFSVFDKAYNKLSKKHPRIFPPLCYSSTSLELLKEFGFPSNVSTGLPLVKYIFRPYRLEGFDESLLRSKLPSSDRLYKRKQSELPDRSLNKQNDFEVVFLGTGSRVSSILRNTSGILLNMRGKTSLLMDCGEGTYRQICHHYGKDVDQILKQLRMVFVSHMHIDHHLGLATILLQRKRLVKSNDFVRVIGPESLDIFLRYFEMLSGESLNFRFTQFWWLRRESGKKEGRVFSESLGLSSIDVIPTKHSDYSHGVVLQRNGWKIVYSADTRPCKQLIDAGEGATLLVHEATFEDQLIERAKAMNHCTVSEAIRVSELMKAQHAILTHISSRHLFPCKVSRLPKGVSFAFDHMTVQQKDLPTLHEIMPSVEKTVLQSNQTRRRARRKPQNFQTSRNSGNL